MIWDFLMFHQTYFSLQVKQGVIISNKLGIHELRHKLPNNMQILSILAQNSLKMTMEPSL